MSGNTFTHMTFNSSSALAKAVLHAAAARQARTVVFRLQNAILVLLACDEGTIRSAELSWRWEISNVWRMSEIAMSAGLAYLAYL